MYLETVLSLNTVIKVHTNLQNNKYKMAILKLKNLQAILFTGMKKEVSYSQYSILLYSINLAYRIFLYSMAKKI